MVYYKKHFQVESIAWIALFIYFMLMFCVSSTVFPFRPYFLTALPLIILVIEVVILNRELLISRSLVSFIFLYIIGLISSIINASFFELTALQNFLQYPSICLGIYLICDSKDKLLKFLKMIFWLGIIGGPVIGLYQMAVGSYLYPIPAGSIYQNNIFISTIICTAIQYNANYVALHMTFILFIGIYISGQVLDRKKLYLLAVIVTFACLILTYSRTAMIAVALSFLIYLCIKINKYKTALKAVEKIYLLLIITTIILIIIAVSGIDIFVFIEQSLSANIKKLMVIKDKGNVTIRFVQWKSSIEAIANAPILNMFFGFGDNYINVLERYSGYNISTHNTIFQQLMMNGLIGVIITIVIMLSTFKKFLILNKNSFKESILLCGYISLILIVQMISALSIELMVFFVLSDLLLELNSRGSVYNESKRPDIS